MLRDRIRRMERVYGVETPDVPQSRFLEEYSDGRRRLIGGWPDHVDIDIPAGDPLPEGYRFIVIVRP